MKKRSGYRPKGVRLDNVSWVLAGIKPLTELPDVNAIVRAKNHGAMRALVLGQGTKEDVQTVVQAINMTEALGFCCSRKKPFCSGMARWTRASATSARAVMVRVSSPSRPR